METHCDDLELLLKANNRLIKDVNYLYAENDALRKAFRAYSLYCGAIVATAFIGIAHAILVIYRSH